MWFLGYRFRFHFLFNLSICPSTFVFWALSIIYFDTLTTLFLGLGKSFIKYIFPKDAKTRNVTNASMDLHQNHIPLCESDAMISDHGGCHCSRLPANSSTLWNLQNFTANPSIPTSIYDVKNCYRTPEFPNQKIKFVTL